MAREVSDVANDNAEPLPSPTEFATLLADFVTARDHAMETRSDDDFRAAAAMRMRLIEAYERAYGGRSLLCPARRATPRCELCTGVSGAERGLAVHLRHLGETAGFGARAGYHGRAFILSVEVKRVAIAVGRSDESQGLGRRILHRYPSLCR